MNLPHQERLRIEAWIRDGLAKYILLNEYNLFFFGSRVIDTEPSTSDIDVGFQKQDGGAMPEGALAAMKEYVRELPTLYKIDVVDFGTVSKDFSTIASQHIEAFSP